MLWDAANTGLEAAEKASVAALSGIDTLRYPKPKAEAVSDRSLPYVNGSLGLDSDGPAAVAKSCG